MIVNMKMKKSSEPNITDLEQSSRLYRHATAIVKVLDDGLQKSQDIPDLFNPGLVTQRCRLKEHCEKIIFINSPVHSRKAEELLWRKGYYDVINFAKQFKKTGAWTSKQQTLLQNHILSGIGYYHHVILKLQSEFNFDLQGKVDCALIRNVHCGQKENFDIKGEGAVIWCVQTCQRCLICLGDLARYLMEFRTASVGSELEMKNEWLEAALWARRYYCQALMMNPNIGLPHNQMGTMAGSKNYGLDGVYHYMRCILCEQSFEGAEGNLKRILERNEKQFIELVEDVRDIRSNVSPSDNIQKFLLSFLNLVNMFYYQKENSLDIIPQLCQRTLMDFRTCLSYNDNEENYSHTDEQLTLKALTEDNIYHILLISIMCVWRLHNKIPGSSHTSLTIAFTLAYVSCLIQYTVESLEESLDRYGIVVKESIDTSVTVNGIVESVTINANNDFSQHRPNEDNANEDEKLSKKKKKSKWEQLRRRKRNMSNSDDSVQSEGEFSGSDEDLTDDKSVASETSDLGSREFAAFNSESEDENTGDLEGVLLTKPYLNESFHQDIDVDDKEKSNVTATSNDMNVTRALEHISILTEMRSLVVIRVACHWLRCNTEVISACGPSSRTLWARFVSLLNLIQVDWNVLKIDGLHSGIIKILNLEQSSDEKASFVDPKALSEDIELRGLAPFDEVYQSRNWDSVSSQWLSEREEAILRIFSLQNFGHFLTALPDTGVVYNKETNKFEMGVAKPASVTIMNGETKMDDPKEITDRMDSDPGRKQLMRSMAHLWLKSEVRDLEKQVKRNINMNFVSPYVIADTAVFTEHSHLLKKLLDNRAFILIVPSVVISQLDSLKNQHLGAREAIRWLESQFRRGSRYIRAQRNHERTPLSRLKYPKRKERQAWNFFQILECCNYFCHQGSNNGGDGKLVTLLTGDDATENGAPSGDFSAKGLTSSAGVNYEHIATFHQRWTQKTPG